MNRSHWLALAFAAMCVAQLAVPASMILRHEATLRDGELYRFECAPVDPSDPFRGRYVALAFQQRTVPLDGSITVGPGDVLYVRLARDDDGFARLSEPSTEAPDSGAFLEVRVLHASQREATIRLPFDRYYMAEALAPEAEAAYRRRVRERDDKTFVTVRVRDGHAALEDLYLDGVPVRQYLEANRARTP